MLHIVYIAHWRPLLLYTVLDGVWGMGYGVWGMGYRVYGIGYRVWGMGYGVWGWGER